VTTSIKEFYDDDNDKPKISRYLERHKCGFMTCLITEQWAQTH